MELPTSGDGQSGRLQEWVLEARGGSRAALGRILELCRQYLLLVANRELEPELWAKGGASDLVQETFLEAQKDFGSFEGTTRAEVLAWLRRILLNNVSNFRRRYVGSEKRQIARELSLDRPGMSSDGRFARRSTRRRRAGGRRPMKNPGPWIRRSSVCRPITAR